jgi:hypothetical protein
MIVHELLGKARSMDQHVGVLVVHGIGEQKRFETTRQVARSVMAGLQARNDGAHFSLIDRASNSDGIPMTCPRIDRPSSPFMIACRAKGSTDKTFVYLHEVWWSDLGAPATISEQFRFWLWGLGQWGAKVVWKSHFAKAKDSVASDPKAQSTNNTDLFMEPPTRFKDVRDDAQIAYARPLPRFMLFLTGLYALLTLFSWEGVKRVFSWLSSAAGSPSILTSYVGDVRIYTQGPGKGGGNITDIGQPWRATIRRRMISQLVAMAERDYARWYVMAHSLGSIVAFNAVQEPEWNLPNYLDPGHAERLRTGRPDLWVDRPPATGEPVPDLNKMMPRRPIWLSENDRISRSGLFKNFCGLITYGSPLDKFAALWPRIVPINRQRNVFSADADWINLSDATDPVGADIEAFEAGWSFGTSADRSPFNIRVKASPFFLLAHIRYFGSPKPRNDDWPETRALVELLFPKDGKAKPLGTVFADVGSHYGSAAARAWLAGAWVIVLGIALIVATSWLALILKGLGDSFFQGVTALLSPDWSPDSWFSSIGLAPDTLQGIWTWFTGLFQFLPVSGFIGTMATTLIIATGVVIAAGFLRRYTEA